MDLHVALPPLVKSEDNAIRRMMRTGPSQSETPATQEHSHVIVVTAPRESGGQLHIPRRPTISCVRSSDFDSSLGRRTRELRQIDQVSKLVCTRLHLPLWSPLDEPDNSPIDPPSPPLAFPALISTFPPLSLKFGPFVAPPPLRVER